MTSFKDAVLAMAKVRPDAPVELIVDLALAVSDDRAEPAPNLNDAQALARWAERQPNVMQYVGQEKKIHAIKELRTLTGSSLIQAKNALDILMPSASSGDRTYNY